MARIITIDNTCQKLVSPKIETTRDYSKIGYYGRPITELSREELLDAFVQLVEFYEESKAVNKWYQDVLDKMK